MGRLLSLGIYKFQHLGEHENIAARFYKKALWFIVHQTN